MSSCYTKYFCIFYEIIENMESILLNILIDKLNSWHSKYYSFRLTLVITTFSKKPTFIHIFFPIPYENCMNIYYLFLNENNWVIQFRIVFSLQNFVTIRKFKALSYYKKLASFWQGSSCPSTRVLSPKCNLNLRRKWSCTRGRSALI